MARRIATANPRPSISRSWPASGSTRRARSASSWLIRSVSCRIRVTSSAAIWARTPASVWSWPARRSSTHGRVKVPASGANCGSRSWRCAHGVCWQVFSQALPTLRAGRDAATSFRPVPAHSGCRVPSREQLVSIGFRSRPVADAYGAPLLRDQGPIGRPGTATRSLPRTICPEPSFGHRVASQGLRSAQRSDVEVNWTNTTIRLDRGDMMRSSRTGRVDRAVDASQSRPAG